MAEPSVHARWTCDVEADANRRAESPGSEGSRGASNSEIRTPREYLRRGRGQSLQSAVDALSPLLRGWGSYFRLAEVKGAFEDLDQWLRRKLRCLLWRQWKRTYTRARKLMQRGLDRERARRSAANGHGPWWNAGASHMNQAYPKRFFDRIGLVSLLDQRRRLQLAI